MEISSQMEQYKQDDLWLKSPFSHLSGITEHWAKANAQKTGHETTPLDLASVNDDTFFVHYVINKKESKQEADEDLNWVNGHKGEFRDLATRDWKVGQNPRGEWEVYWEVESPYGSEMLQEINKRYEDYIVSLFSLDDGGLDFTYTASTRGSLKSIKGIFAINKKDNVVVVLVEMTEGNKYDHLMIPNLAKSEPDKLEEANELWKTFTDSYKEAGFRHMDDDTKVIVHGRSSHGDKDFFIGEF